MREDIYAHYTAKNRSEIDRDFRILLWKLPVTFFEAFGTRPNDLQVRSRAIESDLRSIALHLRVNISDARRRGIEQVVTHVADPAAEKNCKRVIPRYRVPVFFIAFDLRGLIRSARRRGIEQGVTYVVDPVAKKTAKVQSRAIEF